MHTTTVFSVELVGLDAHLVEIEADVRGGLPAFMIVGLPGQAVQEARQRIKSAIKNNGLPFPKSVTLINLAPADLRKGGTHYDLPMALGLLGRLGVFDPGLLKDTLVVGELALSGEVRPVRGVLACVEFAVKQGFKKIILPRGNAAEAALLSGPRVLPVSHLKEAVLALQGRLSPVPLRAETPNVTPAPAVDMKDVRGHLQAKRALEIAAAGGHHLTLTGPPGVGKTMLGRALGGILPPMSEAERLEVTKIHSVAGRLPAGEALVSARPFRALHPSATLASMTGGGAGPLPGEISLAHRGVLFMDEAAEFQAGALEALRQPLEEHCITLSRARRSVTFPAQFTWVAAMNPCPCGMRNDPDAPKPCECSGAELRRYDARLSGPLLDRVDMRLRVGRAETLAADLRAESSAQIQARVTRAAALQNERLQPWGLRRNCEMTLNQALECLTATPQAERALESAQRSFRLSGRGITRLLKLSRTIADLEGGGGVTERHVLEALQYRMES